MREMVHNYIGLYIIVGYIYNITLSTYHLRPTRRILCGIIIYSRDDETATIQTISVRCGNIVYRDRTYLGTNTKLSSPARKIRGSYIIIFNTILAACIACAQHLISTVDGCGAHCVCDMYTYAYIILYMYHTKLIL